VDALLAHLHAVGFDGAPRPLGRDALGRQVLEYVPGEIGHDAGTYTPAELASIGRMLADLHRATAIFEAPESAVWNRVIPADRDELVAESLEGLHDRLELEVGADGCRMPRIRIHAVRHVDRSEPERRLGCRLRLGRQRRHHRIEHGQRHRGAKGTAKERAAGQMLLRDDHGCFALT
jgi:hypothetical protein